jgi:hypothetical protein
MRAPFRGRQRVTIQAPLEAVWALNMDLRRIPEFHPRVVRVDVLGATPERSVGNAYQCHLAGGKHWCIEKDIEIVPYRKIVTVLPEDTFGISKILTDYTVESTLERVGKDATIIEIAHFYSTTSLKAKLVNLIAKGRIRRQTEQMLQGMKSAIERTGQRAGNR